MNIILCKYIYFKKDKSGKFMPYYLFVTEKMLFLSVFSSFSLILLYYGSCSEEFVGMQ